jgi:hypothetical protein
MSKLNATQTENNLNTNTEVSIMNLFDDIAVEEARSPRDWTLEDCKKKLTVIFKEPTEGDCIDVSIRLQGFTFLKIQNQKTVFKMKKGEMSKGEVLERVQQADAVILEAKSRLIASLDKARTSRETTFKRKPKGERPPEDSNKEEDGQEDSQPSFSE